MSSIHKKYEYYSLIKEMNNSKFKQSIFQNFKKFSFKNFLKINAMIFLPKKFISLKIIDNVLCAKIDIIMPNFNKKIS